MHTIKNIVWKRTWNTNRYGILCDEKIDKPSIFKLCKNRSDTFPLTFSAKINGKLCKSIGKTFSDLLHGNFCEKVPRQFGNAQNLRYFLKNISLNS